VRAEPLRPRTPTQVTLLFECTRRVGWNARNFQLPVDEVFGAGQFIDEVFRVMEDLFGPPLFR
jgi:hypothetical protein